MRFCHCGKESYYKDVRTNKLCYEHFTIYKKNWWKRNPNKAREYYLNKKAKDPNFAKRKWQSLSKEVKKKLSRQASLRVYNITPQEYEIMFKKQNGTCFICGGFNLDGKPLFVDHNHKTQQVRKLLCRECNLALGNLKEDINRINNLLEYVQSYKLGRIPQQNIYGLRKV